MNHPTLYGIEIQKTGDGHEALELDARVFWQSRMTVGNDVPALPELTDIPKLAREIRQFYAA